MTTRMTTLLTSRRVTACATVFVVGAAYMSTSQPHHLDSASNTNAPTKTLSFPSSMLFSKQLTVTAIEQINHDTKRITFALPGGTREISGVAPGGAILTQHTPAGKWFPVLRPYTPIHDLNERGILQLLVKKYPGGKASDHLHSLSPGQTLTTRGPIPTYTWTPSSTPRTVLLLAGGAGITPIYSLTKGILSNPADTTCVNLVWGVNGARDIVLRDELEKLEAQYPDRLHVTYAVSGPSDLESLGSADKFKAGYVDKTLLHDVIQSCQKGDWGDVQGKKVFVCGPPKMEEAIAGKGGVLAQLGVEKKAIYRF